MWAWELSVLVLGFRVFMKVSVQFCLYKLWYPKQHRPVSQGTSYNPDFHIILILLCRWCRNCYKGKEVDESCCKNGLPSWKGFGDTVEKSLWQDTISLWRVPAGKTCWADCKNLSGYLVPFLFWEFVVHFFVCLAWNIFSAYFMLVWAGGDNSLGSMKM